MKIVSACLLGINCKYKGGNNLNDKVAELSKKEVLIPVCPEQLGGLPTPREPSESRLVRNDDHLEYRVRSMRGIDETSAYQKGAEETLKICQLYGIMEAILKQRSPSCGCGQVYDGSFSKRVICGDGLTTDLLKRNGIKVISEEDL